MALGYGGLSNLIASLLVATLSALDLCGMGTPRGHIAWPWPLCGAGGILSLLMWGNTMLQLSRFNIITYVQFIRLRR